MIFNTKHTANWEYIRERKQSRIKANNKRENAKRTPHTYHQGDRVVLAKGTEYKYEQPYSGPHTIEQVFNNGTVRLRVGAVSSTVNIRRIEPFK
jgi:hypothetical protein